MGRYNVNSIDDDEVEVDEAKSDLANEPWQENFWKQPEVAVKEEPGIDDNVSRGEYCGNPVQRLVNAIVPFGRNREAADYGDDDGLEEPSYFGTIHIVGTRCKRTTLHAEINDDDSENTVDLTDFCAIQECPSETPQYVRNAFPQVRNDSRSRRFNSSVRRINAEPREIDLLPSPQSSSGDPAQDHRPRKGRAMMFWYVVTIIVGMFVQYAVSRAPPPPPPAPVTHALTWKEYFSSAASGANRNLVYVFSAIAFEIRIDYARLFPKQCQLAFPAPTTSGTDQSFEGGKPKKAPLSIEDVLSEEIVGQERAIRIVARGLDYWAESSQLIVGERNHAVSPAHDKEGKPYVMIFSGAEGVGKAAMARQIARLAFQHCPAGQNGVLELHGEDFEDSGEDGEIGTEDAAYSTNETENLHITPLGYASGMEQDRGRLTRVIVDHLRSRSGSGAVVILRQFDRIHPSVVRELLNPLRRGSEAKLSYPLNSATEGGDVQSVEASCRNTLFILTTIVGNRAVIQAAKSSGGMRHASLPDLDRSIKGELNEYFGPISPVINIVAPFAVLGRDELKDILRQTVGKISSANEGKLWKRLDVSNSALNLLTGPKYVDYVQFLSKEGADSVLSPFSERGAHALDDGVLLQMLKGRAMRYLAGSSDRINTDSIAVFSVSIEKGTAMLSWCPDRGEVYKNTIGAECTQVWQEPLQ